ncbi:MAG: LIC_13355 family lipoprotein [Myxococcales bacterium]|nr:LIC_13355 family lipoprotein [Myxococcales bacterium]
MDRAPLTALLLTAACQPDIDANPTLATEVVEAPGHTGEGNRDVELAVNGVRGAGQWAGSVDVFSLGLEPGVDDVLVLGFEGRLAVDVDGPDLAVFENPFDVSGGGRFLDPVVVEVSADCTSFVTFPHRYEPAEPGTFSDDPEAWSGFAGIEPVWLHAEDQPMDPFDEDAGGDRFDLADLDPQEPVAEDVRQLGVMCVRLSSAQLWEDPHTRRPFLAHPVANGADIDGVYAVATVGR